MVTVQHIDLNNPVVMLCVEGSRAEFAGRNDDARKLFLQAWETAHDNYEACIAAHYMARHQDSPQDALYWNLEALARADAVGDASVQAFYASLYVNLGHAYEILGNTVEAKKYYQLAAAHGIVHQVE